jgi:hypothetical protein
MEFNRATTLTKVLVRDRALEARERKDESLRKLCLYDNDAYPGSKKFPQAVEVWIQYMADLGEAEVSSIKDAHEQTGIPITAETVEKAIASLRSSFDTLISARIGAWGGMLGLLNTRTGGMNDGNPAALSEARREMQRQAARLIEKTDAKLDVLLQSSLAASEKGSQVGKMQTQEKPAAESQQAVPTWFHKAGAISALAAFLFVVALVIIAMRGTNVPTSARVLVDIATSLAIASAFSFLGGSAQAEGKIPFAQGQEPIKFATTGGIAVFVVILVLLVWFYH